MEKIQNILGLEPGRRDVVAVCGSGGKTTLLDTLGSAFPGEKILIGATTRLSWPEPALGDFLLTAEEAAASLGPVAPTPQFLDYRPIISGGTAKLRPGRYLCGIPEPQAGKLSSLPVAAITELSALFDKTLIECDGSRRLPLKGWAEYEPVVPECATVAVGVLPVWPLGLKADASVVHRLPEFLVQASALRPISEGLAIGPEHLAGLAAHPQGLFKGSRGRKVLWFNQVEDKSALRAAEKTLNLLPADFLSGLFRVAAGSAAQGQGEILWQHA